MFRFEWDLGQIDLGGGKEPTYDLLAWVLSTGPWRGCLNHATGYKLMYVSQDLQSEQSRLEKIDEEAVCGTPKRVKGLGFFQ